MRLMLIVIVLLVGFAWFQANRNNCKWYGSSQIGNWTECIIGL